VSDPLAQVTEALVDVFRPLARIVGDADAATAWFQELGFDVELDVGAVDALNDAVPSLSRVQSELVPLADRLAGGEELTLADGVAVAALVADLTADLRAVADGSAALGRLPAPLDEAETWVDLAAAIPANLVAAWFEAAVPAVYVPLRLAGAIRSWIDGRGRRQRTVDWAVVADLIKDPLGAVQTEYGWGGEFDHVALLIAVRDIALATGSALRWSLPTGSVAEEWFPGGVPYGLRSLRVDFGDAAIADGSVSGEVGVELVPIPADPTEPVSGLALVNHSVIEAGIELPVTDDWTVALSGEVDASAAFAVELFPGAPPSVTSATPVVDLVVALRGEPSADEPWLLFGRREGLRLTLDGVELSAGLSGPVDDIELTAGLATLGEGLSLFIPTGTGDPFVSEMVSQGIEAGAVVDLLWSSKHGVTLDGSVSLRVVIPIDKWIGPIHLLYLDIEMTFGDPSELSLAVAFAVEIGPITVTLDGIGLRLIGAVAADGDGHLGPFDLELAFKPPTGFGVVIDIADIVTGGGFLEFDPDRGEYSGVFAVQVLEGLGLTAVGMLTAPLPGQDDGWSLFFSITARFPFPIQLSFGFTLNAIGALVGIHRRMDVDAIGAGLADGSLDAIMFPDDPVANAPIILESLRTSFPEARGQYVFGAMVEIGWLPPLVSAQLGIIVQLPDPLQIVIVGQAECILPTKDAPLLELRTDVFGVIDLTAGTIAIDADLRDSRLVLLALTGSIAVRAAFLDDPSLLMAAGGFHPAFTAPPSFPSLERLGVALNVPDALDVRLEAYVAITSNTLQFGARFSFFGKAGPITAEGGAGFDALITFTPFGLTVGVDFGATIKVAGFDALGALLSLQVSGPAPWRFVGTATFTLAGLEKDFHLDESIGRPAPAAPVPAVNVATLVCDALAQPDNWEILASADTGGVVLLAPVSPEPALDPGGGLQVRQQVAPLEVELDRYGEAPISGPSTVHVSSVQLGNAKATSATITDWFASAVYWDLGRTERLSAPSFEHHPAGYSLTATESSVAGATRSTLIDHDTDLWEDDTLDLQLEPPPPGILDVVIVRACTSHALVTMPRPTSEFTFNDLTYAAVSSVTGRLVSTTSGTYIATRKLTTSEFAGSLVIPLSEVSA
jgi:hypothetical protein